MQDRDTKIPVGGARESLSTLRKQKQCEAWGSEPDDVHLSGYDYCTLEFSKSQFDRSPDNKIVLYVNHPGKILSWVETCNNTDQSCITENLEQGLAYEVE